MQARMTVRYSVALDVRVALLAVEPLFDFAVLINRDTAIVSRFV